MLDRIDRQRALSLVVPVGADDRPPLTVRKPGATNPPKPSSVVSSRGARSLAATRPGTSAPLYITLLPGAFDDEAIDEVAVERAVNGERPETMTREELAAAGRILDGRGMGASEIAARIGIGTETARRWQVNGWDPDGKLPVPRQPRELIPCPSPAAYRRHRVRGENCAACSAANTAADRRYRLTGKRAG